ncbi:hypothetical protein QBC37DRAFT_296570, partial [Rhypophila decipiens]
NVAVSSTHFVQARFTTAVFYGCDDDQMDRVFELLTRSPDVMGHRLLSIGIFAELLSDHLEKRVLDVKEASTGITLKFGGWWGPHGRRPDNVKKYNQWQLNEDTFQLRADDTAIQEDVNAAKTHITRILDVISESEEAEQRPISASNTSGNLSSFAYQSNCAGTERFKRRLRQLCVQYERMAGICQAQLDQMTFMRDFYMANYTAREVKAGKALAFAAMIYLPRTSVVTIMAMPIFDWKARWLDFYLHFSPQSSEDSPSANVSNPDSTTVLSGYFWIYLAVSIFVTILTVGSWMLYSFDEQVRWPVTMKD